MEDDRDCIEDLLEEVRERLKYEMQGNMLKKGSVVRGGGIETPFKEKRAYDAKETRSPVAKHVKENPSRDSSSSDGSPMEPVFDDSRRRLEKARDILNAAHGNHSWRGDRDIQEQPSPRNLVRSLSAPVSGMSFGKLLLEDRHVSSGAHIKRKHEAFENLSMDVKDQRKERFNLREKVSSLKHSLS